MATYNVYQDDELIAEEIKGKEYTATGLTPNTEYSFAVSEVIGDKESEKATVTVTTDEANIDSQESLVSAIVDASAGDTIKLTGDLNLESNVIITKDITIDGGGHVITSETDDIALFAINEGDVTLDDINIELSGENSRAFLLNEEAGDFNLNESTVTGESPDSSDGQRGISSNHGYGGVVTIDEVEFNKLRTGIYTIANHALGVNQSTFDSNYRGMTISGSTVPTLTNNTFTDNDGDISVASDSTIKDEIEQEAEDADNNNTFDGGTPKYNWGNVTGVTLSPKTSTGETEAAGEKKLTATVEPSDARNKDVTYSIDDAEGLTVSSSGKIEWTADTPTGEYTTTVTTDDGDFTDTHVLTLEEPEPEPEPDPDPEDDE